MVSASYDDHLLKTGNSNHNISDGCKNVIQKIES